LWTSLGAQKQTHRIVLARRTDLGSQLFLLIKPDSETAIGGEHLIRGKPGKLSGAGLRRLEQNESLNSAKWEIRGTLYLNKKNRRDLSNGEKRRQSNMLVKTKKGEPTAKVQTKLQKLKRCGIKSVTECTRGTEHS